MSSGRVEGRASYGVPVRGIGSGMELGGQECRGVAPWLTVATVRADTKSGRRRTLQMIHSLARSPTFWRSR